MFDVLLRVRIHNIFKQLFLLTTEVGDLYADPVIEDLEVFGVGAAGDEVVKGSKPLLEVAIDPLVVAIVNKRGDDKLKESGEGEKG